MSSEHAPAPPGPREEGVPAVGELLGGWRLEELLGAGGMGLVYRAVQAESGLVAALKVFRVSPREMQQALPRFRREVLTLAELEHPLVVRILQESLDHEPPFFCMELLPGGSLAHRLETEAARGRKGLAAVPVERLVLELAAGLDAIHRRRVIHRDIKPQNVLFAVDGQAKLTDFGMARVLDRTAMTVAGQVLGTLAYLPPEMLRGLPADERSDLYQLGVTLFEAATGELPDSGREPAGQNEARVPGRLPRLAERAPELAERLPWLEPVLDRLTAFAPEERYSTASALLEEVRAKVDPGSAGRRPVSGTPRSAIRRSGSGAVPRRSGKPAPIAAGASAAPTSAAGSGARVPAPSGGRRWLVPAAIGVALLACLGLASRSAWFAASPGPTSSVPGKPATPEAGPPAPVAIPAPAGVAAGVSAVRLELTEPAPPGLNVELTSQRPPRRIESVFPEGTRELLLEGLSPATVYNGLLTRDGKRTPFQFTTLTGGAMRGATLLASNLSQDGGFTVAANGRQVVLLWSEPVPGGGTMLESRESADAGRTWSGVRSVERIAGRCDGLALAFTPGGLWAGWRALPGDRSSPVQLRLWPGPTTASGPVLPMSLTLNVTSFSMMPAGTRAVDVYACLMKHSGTSGQIHQVSQVHVTEGSVGGLAPRRIIELDKGSVLMGIRFARGQGREFGFAAVLRESLLGLHWTSGAQEGTSAWSALTPLTARDEWTGGIDVAVGSEHVVAAYEEGSVRPLIQGKIVTRRSPARGGDWSPAQRVCGTASPPVLTCFRNVFYLANLEGASERRLTFDLWSSASGSDWKLVEQWPLPEPPSGASQPIQLAAASDRLLLFEVNTGGRLLAVPLSVSRP